MLVTGLLAIGQVADREGVFDRAAAHVERIPGPPAVLYGACLALVAAITALLNLDTAAVFATPVLIVAARRRALDPAPFLYGAILMTNASSLFLPGSNLTNLLVRSAGGLHTGSGAAFFAQMLPYSLSAATVTAVALLLRHRSALASSGAPAGGAGGEDTRLVRLPSFWAAALAAVAIVALGNAALVVLAIALLLAAAAVARGLIEPRAMLADLGLGTIALLFVLAVALGWVARESSFPASLLSGAGAPLTAVVAAGGSLLVNNLPAAVLLSARGGVGHGPALLLGLGVGPNIAASGSLSVLLWWRAARGQGERPSLRRYSLEGAPVGLLAIAVALAIGST